jgi:actin-related protein 6
MFIELKGFLVDWGLEKRIWDRLLGASILAIEPSESGLIITEPWFDPMSIQESYDQIVFEEYGFSSYFRTSGEFRPRKNHEYLSRVS